MTTVDIAEFVPLMPEIFVLTMACIILLVDMFLSDKQRDITYYLSIATLAGAAVLTYVMTPSAAQVVLAGTFVSDGLSSLLKIVVYLITIGVFIYSRQYLADRDLYKGEFFVLALFAVLGMMVLASSHNMISIYLGLELLSLSLYAMVAMNRDSLISTEAAMKYFVLGALASGLLLYGMSMLYGATGSLDLAEISQYIADHPEKDMVLLLGMVFALVGLAFKLGAVPFHMWVPDVYDGAPTAVTLFIGTAPKLAGFAMLMRLLVDGLGGISADWAQLLVILAVLSLAIGNIVAIAQDNIKRMLAYSTIAHMGFLFMGILAATPEGYSAALYYTVAYAIMGLGGFGMILLLSRSGFEADKLSDFAGLNDRSPWFAFVMLIFMISMAGIPPVLGFYAKLAVLEAAVSAGYTWLAIYAVIFSIVGAFYYLRVIKVMYFDKAEEQPALQAPKDMQAAMSVNGLGVLLLGIFPGSLIAVCAAAFN
jgi:NADH-quinone oxidoreductase subunit N